METPNRVQPNATDDGQIQVFFDGDCPLCRREIAFLSKRDTQDRIIVTDIAETSFDASQYGRSHLDFMATIQGRTADGRWISGVEVFRQLYSAVGFKRLVRISRVRPIAWVLDRAYTVFAKHRLRLTGRGNCKESACTIPSAAANTNEAKVGILVHEAGSRTILTNKQPSRSLRSSAGRLN